MQSKDVYEIDFHETGSSISTNLNNSTTIIRMIEIVDNTSKPDNMQVIHDDHCYSMKNFNFIPNSELHSLGNTESHEVSNVDVLNNENENVNFINAIPIKTSQNIYNEETMLTIDSIDHDHGYFINSNKTLINNDCSHELNQIHTEYPRINNNNTNILNDISQENIQNVNVEAQNISIDHDHTFIRNINNLNVIANVIHTNYPPAISEHYIGEMDVECIHCSAKHFPAERVDRKGDSFNDCCNHGNIELNQIPNFPHELQLLFNSEHEKSNAFFKHIRLYNNLFSFSSFNAHLINFSDRRPGPYCFKIQGQIYYQINTSLYPESNERPSYGQLFIVDANEAIEHRMAFNAGLDMDITQLIEQTMRVLRYA